MKKSSLYIFLGVIAIDLFSKYLVLTGVIRAEVVKNPGLPFVGKVFPGFFDVGLVLLALIIFTFLYGKYFRRGSETAMGLILGGGLANFTDRLVTGAVTDFLDIGLSGKFNFADAAIWAGILILGYNVIKEKFEARSTKHETNSNDQNLNV